MTPRRLLPLAVLGLLAACSAPAPPNYYTLVPDAQSAAAPAAGPGRAGVIDLMPVSVPAPIDIPQVVVRTGQGEVVPLNGERWAGPLADEIRSALAARLASRLGMPVVQDLRPDPGTRAWRVQVEVQRFDSLPGRQAVLDAVWRVRSPVGPRAGSGTAKVPDAAGEAASRSGTGGRSTPVCRSHFETPATEDIAALVQAHQRNLAALGDAIASAAENAEAGRPACPG